MAVDRVGNIRGPEGRGIQSVTRTTGNGAPGTTDTYTITYTDATTSTFQVRNGADGTNGGGGSGGLTEEQVLALIGQNPSTSTGHEPYPRMHAIVGQPAPDDRDYDLLVDQSWNGYTVSSQPPAPYDAFRTPFVDPPLLMTGYQGIPRLTGAQPLVWDQSVEGVTWGNESDSYAPEGAEHLDDLSFEPNLSVCVMRKMLAVADMKSDTAAIIGRINFSPPPERINDFSPNLTIETYVGWGMPIRFTGTDEALINVFGVPGENGSLTCVFPFNVDGLHPKQEPPRYEDGVDKVNFAAGNTFVSLPSKAGVEAALASTLNQYGSIPDLTIDCPDESVYLIVRKGYETDTPFKMHFQGFLNTDQPWNATAHFAGKLLNEPVDQTDPVTLPDNMLRRAPLRKDELGVRLADHLPDQFLVSTPGENDYATVRPSPGDPDRYVTRYNGLFRVSLRMNTDSLNFPSGIEFTSTVNLGPWEDSLVVHAVTVEGEGFSVETEERVVNLNQLLDVQPNLVMDLVGRDRPSPWYVDTFLTIVPLAVEHQYVSTRV